MIWLICWAMFLLGFGAGLWWRAWVADRREADERAWALGQFRERVRRRFAVLLAERRN